MLKYHKTIDDLAILHPIRQSWCLVEEALEEEHTIFNVEDMEVGGIEGEDAEDVKGEESDAEVVGEADQECVSAWPNTTAPSSPVFSVLTDDGSLPPTSDASAEFIEVIDNDDEQGQGGATLKRKASDELDPATKRWKAARTEEAGML